MKSKIDVLGLRMKVCFRYAIAMKKMRRNGRAIAAQLLRRKNATKAFWLLYKIQTSCYARKWGSGAAKIPLQ